MITSAHRPGTVGRTCPKCGYGLMRIRRACCGDRRRGIKAFAKCVRCGYREAVTGD